MICYIIESSIIAVPNDSDDYPKHLVAPQPYPASQVCMDNTDEVFEPNTNLVSAQCPVSEPRTTGRSVDDVDDEFSSEEFPEPDEQVTEEDASAEEDAMGRKTKQPQLKGKYAKLAAMAAQAADEAQAAARAEAREQAEQAKRKGKGKGKRGSAAPGAAPAASTSAEQPSTSAASDGGASASAGDGAGPSSSAGEDGESQDEPPAAGLPEPPHTIIRPIPRRMPLPYTFYNIHGKNIKLCSSGKYKKNSSYFFEL